ncbi:MAG: hypothetical protein HY706_09580 [Candidatus Hydrogenedentes bacterium]|nr:hypothetical protein [Candidatus Hydrogenedentota bacterium]
MNHALGPVAIVAVLFLIFVLTKLAVHGWDPSSFVTAGDKFCDPSAVPPGLYVFPNSDGHDGQFYYRFALNPFTRERTEFGITVDLPAYRHQRILYPLLVWILTFGHHAWVPLVMLAVNYIGLCLLTWFAAKYLQTKGYPPIYGLLITCYPGFLLTLSRDFTEIVAATLLLVSLWLAAQQRHRAAATILCSAVLARETSLLLACALVGLGLWRRILRQSRNALPWYGAPILVFLIWNLCLSYMWNGGTATTAGVLSMPFQGLAESAMDKLSALSFRNAAYLAEMTLIILFAGAVAAALRSSAALTHEKIAWVLYAALAAIVSRNVWSEDWSFLRNLYELYVFGAIILLQSRSRLKTPLFACWIACWLALYTLRLDLHHLFR